MSMRKVVWGSLAALLALGWIGAGVSESVAHSTVAPALAPLLLTSAVVAFLLISARGHRRLKAKADRELQQLIAQPLAPVQPGLALLKRDETAYGAIKATLLELKTTGYSAGSSGVSVRVAKGVTLRSGGTRALPVKEMVPVADGELVVTDRRVVFSGDRKSFSIARDDLLNVTNYTDGFGFSTDEGKTYTLRTADEAARVRFAVAVQKVIRGPRPA